MSRLKRPFWASDLTLRELILMLPGLMCLGLVIAGVGTRIITGRPEGMPTNRARMMTLEAVLYEYKLDVGSLPSTEQSLLALIENPGVRRWKGPYLKAMPKDQWGNAYTYVREGVAAYGWNLYSIGPDGRDGTEDDVGIKLE